MDKKEAEYCMRRCVDSGLWVPNAADLEKEQQKEEDEEEEVYEEALEN